MRLLVLISGWRRKRVCRAVVDIAAAHGGGKAAAVDEERMWSKCFHHVVLYIERKAASAASEHTQAALLAALETLLAEGIRVYGELFEAARKDVLLRAVCRIRVGDLRRYRFKCLGDVAAKEHARAAYLEAVALDKSSGHAQNQLGVLALTGEPDQTDPLEAMFRYLLATKAEVPFVVAAKNLEDTVASWRHVLLDGEPVKCVRRVCLLAYLEDETGLLRHVNFCLLSPEPRHLPSILIGLHVVCHKRWGAGLELEVLVKLLNRLREEPGPEAPLETPLEEIDVARRCGLTYIDPCVASVGARVMEQLRVRQLVRVAQLLCDHDIGLDFSSSSGLFQVNKQSSFKRLKTSSATSFRAGQSRVS